MIELGSEVEVYAKFEVTVLCVMSAPFKNFSPRRTIQFLILKKHIRYTYDTTSTTNQTPFYFMTFIYRRCSLLTYDLCCQNSEMKMLMVKMREEDCVQFFSFVLQTES